MTREAKCLVLLWTIFSVHARLRLRTRRVKALDTYDTFLARTLYLTTTGSPVLW